MERNPTARAMDWSVELENGLRAKSPLRRAQAISDFAPRLLLWSREPIPQPSHSAHQLFDLIPGEDRLFANAILLRLADAFKLGDHRTRVCVVKVFLAEHRDRAKRKVGYGGLLSKDRVSNCSELLGRVKAVFDDGDVESKSLALGLFGCWAGFAVESSHIRYLVLSSMVSSHVSEAKAAFFAAGCFCEVSDDFPLVVLEMLKNLMTSSETLLPVRLAAARVYAKLGKSYSTAAKSYKTGLKILLDSSEEDFQVALLVSLSKLASRLSILISDQVHLLVSLLCQENSLQVRATALRCLLFIFSKGVCQLFAHADLVKVLFNMLDEPELPTNMQSEALRILRKIILYMHPGSPCDIFDLGKLTTIAETASVSPFTSTSLLAIYVVVDFAKKCKVSRDLDSSLPYCFQIPKQVVLLIMRQINALVQSVINPIDASKFQKINELLNLLLSVVKEDKDLVLPVLDQIVVLVRYLGSMNASKIIDTTRTDVSAQDNVDTEGEKSKGITLKLLCNVYRFLVSCLECLNEAGAINMPVFDKVKLLVENVCEFKVLDIYTQTIYSMLLHSPHIWGHYMNETEKGLNFDVKPHMLLHSYSIGQELIVLEFTKKILAENKNWMAYRIGAYLACRGVWFSSSLIFKHLITYVHTDSCCSWLRSLFHFASSGRKIMLLLRAEDFSNQDGMKEATKLHPELLHDDLEEIGHDSTYPFYKLNCTKLVLSAYRSICLAKETLEIDLTPGKAFCFQRWFLFMRAKTIRAVVDALQTLETIPFLREKHSRSWQDEKNVLVECLLLLRQVSLRLNRLAKEFDVLSASFMDMDRRSSKFISSLALTILLLGFITSFLFFIPTILETSPGMKNSKDIVQNLAGRLWYVDHEMSTKLCQLIDDGDRTDTNFVHLQSRNDPFNVVSEARDILNVCGFAVSKISCLRSEADKTRNEESASRLMQDGLQLTLELLNLWMQIPFRIPKYFFRFRPCIGSELFAVSVNKNPDAICVLPGYHLPLSVCLQLRNVPSELPVRPAKLHCMLYSSTSFQDQEINSRCNNSYQAWETDDIVEMNEKLLLYVKSSAAKNVGHNGSNTSGSDDSRIVSSFICCELNEKGQGFSSCLLDVSSFPIGSFRIKWQCCCIDTEGNYWNFLPLNAGPVFTIE